MIRDLSNLLNQYFPDHGNWEGVNGGKVAVLFLTYILSCHDHRLSHVEQWADRIQWIGLEQLKEINFDLCCSQIYKEYSCYARVPIDAQLLLEQSNGQFYRYKTGRN